MLDASNETAFATADATPEAGDAHDDPRAIERLLAGVAIRRRMIGARQTVFRTGQPQSALYLLHAGVVRTSVAAPDGREKVTGFRLRGDLLGLESLGTGRHACDAVALDTGELWEIPLAQLATIPGLQERLAAALATEIRRDWQWMLTVATLTAEQRVVAFLLDLARRLEALGYSPRHVMLRMTRGDVGNFLSLQLETVVRALSKLQAGGLIGIDHREITIHDRAGLEAILAPAVRLAA